MKFEVLLKPHRRAAIVSAESIRWKRFLARVRQSLASILPKRYADALNDYQLTRIIGDSLKPLGYELDTLRGDGAAGTGP